MGLPHPPGTGTGSNATHRAARGRVKNHDVAAGHKGENPVCLLDVEEQHVRADRVRSGRSKAQCCRLPGGKVDDIDQGRRRTRHQPA